MEFVLMIALEEYHQRQIVMRWFMVWLNILLVSIYSEYFQIMNWYGSVGLGREML